MSHVGGVYFFFYLQPSTPHTIEDEFHLIIECPRYSSYINILFLKACDQMSGFQHMKNSNRFKLLMKIDQNSIKREFIQFIQYILNER